MITVKNIPNILDKNNREEKELNFRRNKVLIDYLEESGFYYRDKKIIVSGKIYNSLNLFIEDKDEIIITPNIKGPVLAVGAFILGTVAKLGFITIATAIVTAVTSVAAKKAIPAALNTSLASPSIPNFGVASVSSSSPAVGVSTGIDTSSPTYGWEGIQTIQEVGVPIPVICGRHKVGGNVINAYIRNNGDKNYLNVLLALSHGEINSIDDIKINNNPYTNFDGISVTKKYGTNDQSVISNFEDSHNLYDVNVVLTKDNAHTYTTFDSDVEGFQIYLRFPSGLFTQEADSGNIVSWTVTYKVEYKVHSDPTWINLGSVSVSEKTRSVLRRVYRKVGLDPNQYDIKVTRTSADSDFRHIGDLYWAQIDELKENDFSYPGIALLGIEALATEQLSGSMPQFSCVVEGIKFSIPDIKNGEDSVDWEDYYWDSETEEYKLFSDDTVLSWDEETFVEKWNANPIWFVKHLIINDIYGLGDYINTDHIDDDLWLEMSRHCEEKVPDGNGGYEKRFELHCVLDGPAKAPDLLDQLCLVFRGLRYYSSGKTNIRIDKPEDSTQLFTMGNIIENRFVQNWKSIKDRPNIIEVQFLDQDKDYEQNTVPYIDEESIIAGDPIRKETIKLLTTKKSQIIREARYILKSAKNLVKTVGFKAGIGAITCQAGDVIDFSHDVPQYGLSGRVKDDSTTSKVVLDREVTIEVDKTYKILVQFSDNTIEERTVTNEPGLFTEITVSSPFSQTPQNYDNYAFGETNKVKEQFRIISLEKDNKDEVQIIGIEYNELAYDDSVFDIPDDNHSMLDLSIPNVENLVLTERLVKLLDGTIEDAIDVWFDIPARDSGTYLRRFSKARIYLSENNVDWTLRGETLTRHFPIVGNLKDKTTYYVKVVTVTDDLAENSLDNSPTENITIAGKSAPPSDVSTFLVNQNRDRLLFGWTEIDDVDVWGYEIRKGSSWDSGIKVTFAQGNKYITTELKEAADQKYWIKAIDTSQNYSENATEAEITIDNIPFRNIIKEYSEQTDWLGSMDGTQKDGDNLKLRDIASWGEVAESTWEDLASLTWGTLGPGVLTGTYVTPTRDLGYIATVYIDVSLTITTSTGRRFDDDGTTRFDDSLTLRFTGDETTEAAELEIRTSEDDIDWTEWKQFQAADYKCRYFELRLTLTRESLGDNLLCSVFNYLGDLPDIDEYGDDEVTDAGAGKEITFEKTYHEEPVVNINILTGDGIYYKTSSKDTVGMTVKLYDASGVAKTGTFEYHIHGI